MSGEIAYERMHTPNRSYLVALDKRVIGVVSLGRAVWTATTTSRPHLTFTGSERHETVMAMLDKLAELGLM